MKNVEKLSDTISRACDISGDNLDKILFYIGELVQWNMVHNLVSRKLGETDVVENVIDSILGIQFLAAVPEITDAGSGNGMPGILLAILKQPQKITLVEVAQKKCSFLRIVKAHLGLTNVSVVGKKIEELQPCSYIISKAAFSPENLWKLAHAVVDGGKVALWCTPKSKQSLVDAGEKCNLREAATHSYELPSGKERCILILEKKT